MIDFSIFTLGCKVNQQESAAIANSLVKNNFTVSLDLVPAKNYILNTCSVTHEADKKSHQSVARALKLAPNANIFIIGCSSQFDPKAFSSKQNVRIIAGTSDKNKFLEQVLECASVAKQENSETKSAIAVTPLAKKYENLSKPINSKTRALLKVQDGCDKYCSYCIVPYLRGASRSRDLTDIICEAKELAKDAKEIIITGICLSDYKQDGNLALASLMHELGKIDVPRKRVGSLHPDCITPQILQNMLDAGFCDHIHLSVQSGSTSVLKRMNRSYTAEQVLEKIKLIRNFLPNCGIMTDIISGFSAESDKEFKETQEFLKVANFADAHIFAYSEREGTKAASYKQVPKSIRAERAKALKQIVQNSKLEFLNNQIGKHAQVLFENNGAGYSTNYLKVYGNFAPNTIVDVKTTKLHKDGLWAESI